MEIKDILKITNGKIIRRSKKKQLGNIKIDSRLVEKGDIFIAIKGRNKDGHDYIESAIENGANLIIVDKALQIYKSVNIIKVNDTLKALQDIAHYIRNLYQIPVIAITGSVGKTTVKELVSKVLETKYKVLKSEGNQNNHIGVPLTLLQLNESYDMVVLEMGMNHQGEIHDLSSIANPDISIITNIGSSHIGLIGSKKNILKAKLEITNGMKDGILILNQDDSELRKVYSNNQTLLRVSSKYQEANIYAYDIKESKNNLSFNVYLDKEYTLTAINRAYISNILIALQVADFFDLNMEEVVDILNNYENTNQRLEQINLGSNIIINDCYNASYESVIGALDLVKKSSKKKIFVLGSILELGQFSKKYHTKIGKELRKIKDCQILLVGEDTKYIYNKNKKTSHHFSSNEEMISYLKNIEIDNNIILIKGSRGMHLEEIVSFLKNP